MPQDLIHFDEFELDSSRYELRRHGQPVNLEKIPMELLLLLAKEGGRLVTRQQIQQQLWGSDVFVDAENGINTAVRKIRRALGDDSENPRFVQTVQRKGYRFMALIREPAEVKKADGPEKRKRVDTDSPTVVKSNNARVWGTREYIMAALVAVIGIAAVLLGLNVQDWRDRLFVHAAKPRIQSLAVLPLESLSGDPEQEYFADGMTEALIMELGKTGIPRVISRLSVMQYKGSKKPLQEIARELNVDAVLEGTVVRSRDRVRVTVHLDRASPEGQLWASAYDRSVRDILDLQDEIARTITDEIQLKLTPQQRGHLASARPVDPEAHDEYLRGRYILGMIFAQHSKKFTNKQYTDLDILAAIGHFKHAIEKDPAYAKAYAGLADGHIQLGNPVWGGHSPKETLFDAKEAATRALELDPSLPEAHFSLAQTLEYEWNWSEAEKEFKLALELNPNYADAHLQYGRFVQALGRNDEALRQMNYAMELNPYDIRTKLYMAWVTWVSRQYDLALNQFESLGDDDGLILTYREKEMYPEALAAWERCKLDHPAQIRNPQLLASVASIYGLQGRKHEAEKLIDELREMARHRYVSGFIFAEAYVGLGQKDQAITWLGRAYEEHDQWMIAIAADPVLDPLHSEPRFRALVRRMSFPIAH